MLHSGASWALGSAPGSAAASPDGPFVLGCLRRGLLTCKRLSSKCGAHLAGRSPRCATGGRDVLVPQRALPPGDWTQRRRLCYPQFFCREGGGNQVEFNVILRCPGSRLAALPLWGNGPAIATCTTAFRCPEALCSACTTHFFFFFFLMGKGEDVGRKDSDINSYQGDPSRGWRGFLLPSVHTEGGGVCARRRGSREVPAQSPGSSLLEPPDAAALPGCGDRGRQGLSRASERTRVSGRMFSVCGPVCPLPALVENGQSPTR